MNNEWSRIKLKRDNKITSLSRLTGSRPHLTILTSIRIVFSNLHYVVIAGLISTIFWIIFSIFDQLLFFTPVFVFYLPDDAVTGFILFTITAILLGIVVGMNVYVLRHSKGLKVNTKSFFSGIISKCAFKHMC